MTKLEISYSGYLAAHGKMPRGYGMWAFLFDSQAEPFVATGKFSQALKDAQTYARVKGFKKITVGS